MIYYIFVFVLGSVIGSFLNVLIFRMPRRISIITPQSFCPGCKRRIKWHQNIPIVSYIILGGRCSECRQTISLRYPIVEALTGLFFVFIFGRFGFGYPFFFIGFYFSALLVITFIDFSFQVIPDVLSIPGIFLGLLFQIFKSNFVPGIIGMAFGGGMILLIRVIGGKIYKKEVMGLGDVYLTAMIGAFVGFPFILPAIFIGALVGAALGIAYIIATRQDRESPIPFGPFLSLGGIAVVIFDPLIYRLLELLGIYL
ncbi:MAG: prepilin peptidase [candidate division WOR-3 bacterium]|nr:MAG: prepilin peptidase [candidate division WOR-3 bacterium]